MTKPCTMGNRSIDNRASIYTNRSTFTPCRVDPQASQCLFPYCLFGLGLGFLSFFAACVVLVSAAFEALPSFPFPCGCAARGFGWGGLGPFPSLQKSPWGRALEPRCRVAVLEQSTYALAVRATALGTQLHGHMWAQT